VFQRPRQRDAADPPSLRITDRNCSPYCLKTEKDREIELLKIEKDSEINRLREETDAFFKSWWSRFL
jgi:hypothetical protein